MIEFTIKTLESNNHQFSVEDETTVAQLKEQIEQEMGIAIEMQRLIFCGRVLTDDRRLADFDVNGKVIHLVPRPPPSPQLRNPSTSTRAPNNERRELRHALEEAQRVIDSMTNHPSTSDTRQGPMIRRHIWSEDPPSDLLMEQHQALMMSPTANRMELVRRSIDDIRDTLTALHNHVFHGGPVPRPRPPAEPMDTDSSPPSESPSTAAPTRKPPATQSTHTRPEPELTNDELGEMAVSMLAPYVRRSSQHTRPNVTRPRDLAQLIEELEALDAEFAPYRSHFMHILRDTNMSQLSESQRTLRSSIAELVCDVLHSFAHAYHALSDISVELGELYPRLASRFSTNGHTNPVQAHINAMQAARQAAAAVSNSGPTVAPPRAPYYQRITTSVPFLNTNTTNSSQANAAGGSGAGTDGARASGSGATAASGNTGAAENTGATAASGVFGVAGNTEATGNTAATGTTGATGTTATSTDANAATGANAQRTNPESVTYQVEIETRVPIALPIDAAILNGLAAVAMNHQHGHMFPNEQNQGTQQAPPQDQPMGEEQSQPQGQSPAQPQDQAAGQANRPRVLSDIENLLRALSQNHPGVEVVMSMEEITPLTAAPQTGTVPTVTFQSARIDGTFGMPDAGQTQSNTGNASGVNPPPGTDAGGTTSTGTGAESGTNTSAGFSTPGFVGPQFAQAQIPVIEGMPTATFGIGPDGNPTFTPGVTSFGTNSFTIQPDGGVLLAPGDNPNDFFQTVIANVFRQQMINNGVPLADLTGTATSNAGTAGTASTTSTVTGDVEATITVSSNLGGTSTVTSNIGTAGNVPVTASTTSSNTSSTGTTSTAPNNAGTATNNTGTTTAATITITTSPLNTMPFTIGSGSGRTSDGMWGMGLGLTQPTVVHYENAAPASGPQVAQNRLGPLSAMARARTLQQAEQRRRNANGNAGSGPARRRQTNARAHRLAIAYMVYDRFLPCDSVHARSRLSVRRLAYHELHNEQMRWRQARRSAFDIDLLRERNVHFTTRHMAIMMRLLSGPVSIEGRFNAFMVTVARTLYMTPGENAAQPRNPTRMPREYLFVRMQMREYIQRLVDSARAHNDFGRCPFDIVASLILTYNADFIDRMNELTPINANADPIDSLRVFLARRLPSIIASVLADSTSEQTMTRFFSVFARFYTDLCALVLGFCADGFEGLRVLYTALIEQSTEGFEQTAREWVRLLSRENLMAIQATIDPRCPTEPAARRYDGTTRPNDCCLYQAGLRSEGHRLSYGQIRQLPHICERHQPQADQLETPPPVTPVTSTPTPPPVPVQPPPPARMDTPETSESLPSMSIPSMTSSTEGSESMPLPDNEDDHSEETFNEDDGSPPLEEDNEPNDAAADAADGPSNNSTDRSSVEMRSATSSPRIDTPDVAPQSDVVPQSDVAPQSDVVPQSDVAPQSDVVPQSDAAPQSDETAEAEALVLSEPDVVMDSPSRSSPDPVRFVSPVMIVEHWGEEWVPVFTRDQRAQRERDRSQEPYSDAYLSGMPSRKRRCVRASRPPTTLDGFINESVREASDRPDALDTTRIRSVLRDSVRSLVRTRADTSEDFDPARYTNAARFLEQPKQAEEEEEEVTKTDKVE